jgi:predicted nucleotidyltransferase component of viral defense system
VNVLAANPILTSRQKDFLFQFARCSLHDRFYLSGGTALAAFHLEHRISEDLDLFSAEEFTVEAVLGFLRSLTAVTKIEYERKFDRRLFLLHYGPSEALKVEFTHYPFPTGHAGIVCEGLSIDSLQDILSNKLAAMTDRQDAKDYVDVYCAFRKRPDLDIENVMREAEQKFGVRGIRHILRGRFLQDPPPASGLRMCQPLDFADLARFYRDQAEHWIRDSID